MNSLEDHQVDRPEVYRRISKGLELTGTNRVNDLFVLRVCSAIFELPDGSTLRRGPSTSLITNNFSQVTIPAGPHPFPFRTRPLSLPGPMIVLPAKVGRCLGFFHTTMPASFSRASSFRALVHWSTCWRSGDQLDSHCRRHLLRPDTGLFHGVGSRDHHT